MDSTGRKTINVTAGDSVEFSLPDNRVGKLTLDIDALLVEKFGGQEVDMCSLLAFEYTRVRTASRLTIPFLRQQNDELRAIIAKWQKVGKRIDKMFDKLILNVPPGSYIDPVELQGSALDIIGRIEKLKTISPNIGIPKKR